MNTFPPPVTDSRGHFLMPGVRASWGTQRNPKGGTVTTFGYGWVRLRGDDGRHVTRKPTRIKVAA